MLVRNFECCDNSPVEREILAKTLSVKDCASFS